MKLKLAVPDPYTTVVVHDGKLDLRELAPVDAAPGYHWEARLDRYSFEIYNTGHREVQATIKFYEVPDGAPEKKIADGQTA